MGRARRTVPLLEVGLSVLVVSSLGLRAALATDWYVDASAADCNAGTGSPQAPFCTIGEALAVAGDGDTIHIARGLYPESMVVTDDVTLFGTEGAELTVVGNVPSTVLRVAGFARVQVEGLRLTGGVAEDGGGIVVETNARLEMDACRVDANTCQFYGGGIHNLGIATITNTTVSGNLADAEYDYCRYPQGGGIYNQGILTLSHSTVSDNLVWDGYYGYELGGGIFNEGTMEIRHSLIHDNDAAAGGAIHNDGPLTIAHTTIAGNHAFETGGVFNYGSTAIVIDHSILALNTGEWIYGGVDGWRRFLSRGYNLIADTEGMTITGDTHLDLLDVDPVFEDPAQGDFSLSPTSPAIDSGDPSEVLGGVDHAGAPRFLDGDLDRVLVLDRGALEFQNVRLALSGNATPGGTITLDTTGTNGLSLFLFAAAAPGEVFFNRYGFLFLDLGPPFLILPFGAIPSQRNFTIPPSAPTPVDLYLQEIGLQSSNSAGNVSNAVTLSIR